ncbi:MAG: RNA-binding protein, partial [Chitinophagaceae bacterium]
FRGDTAIPFFSEIGQLAGISATDWSWSVLLADFDNDGWKDMHITNGVGRDFIHADFLEFSSQVASTIADKAERQKAIRQKLASLEHVKLANYLYINNRDYTYTNAAAGAGIDEPSLSNGAAYADLDNDGDLDLVVNNINDEAFLFLNNTRQPANAATGHYLKFVLQGPDKNRSGFGARLFLYNKGEVQQAEQNPVRGYYSSVDKDLIFGTGAATQVDSVVVVWPDGKKETRRSLPTDSAYTLQHATAATAPVTAYPTQPFLFEAITGKAGIQYRHTEYEFNDFANQRLLPQKFSQMGPYLAIGDVDGDGNTDFFVGGSSGFQGKLFLQNSNASFTGREVGSGPKPEEDMDCLLFDADGDGDLDLLVTAGDVQQPPGSSAYRPRLYRNDGKGKFAVDEKAIPATVQTIAGTVTAADWDKDGDADLFIGGRVSHRYPEIPQSFLLQNNGGVFTDVTAAVCPQLQKAGMITSAAWVDIDNDKQTDLVVAGEWMPLRFFKNDKGSLKEVTTATGLEANEGMWRSLVAADIDNDGDMDLVAGNLGANCTYQVTPEQSMQLYAKDIDNNGSMDPVSFYYIRDKSGEKKLYPAISRAQFADQVPAIKKQFLFAKDYTAASFDKIFTNAQKEGMLQFTCRETRSCYFENLGGGRFRKHALPVETQFAPVNAILADDFDGDGYTDLLLAGNEFQTEVVTGRYDASYGSFLKGSPSGFGYIPNVKTGFFVDGDVKDMAVVPLSKNEKMVVVALNNDSLRVFRLRQRNKQ